MRGVAFALSLAFLCAVPRSAVAADATVSDIARQLHATQSGQHLDFADKNLAKLDLSDLDFKAAGFARANLFGADLSGANLSGSDLSGAMLDRVTIVGTSFQRANLAGASLLRPSVFSTLSQNATEAPNFKQASMRGIRMFGRFTRADFSGADLTDATCAPFGKTGFIEHIWRTELSGANLSGANLTRADMTHALLTFADLRGANLRQVILKDADLTGADLRGADMTGADVSGADLSGARLQDVVGLETIKGKAEALNMDKALR